MRKGGAERLVLDICNELEKRDDIKVKLVVLHPENEYEFLSKDLDIELCNSRVIPSISGKTFADTCELDKIIAEFRPNIIHSHLFEAEMLSRWKPIQGINYYSHCHDNMKQFQNFGIKTLFNKKLLTNYYEKWLMLKRYNACNNRFIAISKNNESYFRKSLPFKFSQNLVLHNNAIDFKNFNTAQTAEHIISKPYRFVTIGSLVDKKNQSFLVDVMSVMKNKGIVCHLDIFGDGVNRDVIFQKIKDLNLTENIALHGIINNVEDFLSASLLYLHSSIEEAFGLVLLEAMAAGLPVVCLDGGGNRDIIEDGKNGFIIDQQDPDLFADKIIELINNKELYTKMSQYAQMFAKKYDIKDYVDKLLELYSA
ncbi:MAG: glycosyltransferase family 4 protein [Bacteroidota bacterium]